MPEHGGAGATYDPSEYAENTGEAPPQKPAVNGHSRTKGSGSGSKEASPSPGAPGGSAQLLVLGGALTNQGVTEEEIRKSPPPKMEEADDAAATMEAAEQEQQHQKMSADDGGSSMLTTGPALEPKVVSESTNLPMAANIPLQALSGAAPPPQWQPSTSLQSSHAGRLYTPPVIPGGLGLSMSGLSLSHASPPHALIASRKGKAGGGGNDSVRASHNGAAAAAAASSEPPAEEQPANGEEQAVAGGEEGGAAGVDGQGGSEDLDLMYDPMLNCYYDPKTNKYYELA